MQLGYLFDDLLSLIMSNNTRLQISVVTNYDILVAQQGKE